MRILLLARSLGRGGAERQLCQLARVLKADGEDVRAAVFYGGGAFDKQLSAVSVPLVLLHKRGPWDVVGTYWRLLRVIREFQPDVIYSFMLGPNIFAAGVKPLVGERKIVWGIRTAAPEWRVYGRGALIASWVESILAKYVDLIICNSEAGRRVCIQRGFPVGKIIVIPNGIDTELFRPDEEARRITRAKLGIRDLDVLVGHVGRLDPHKGHSLFFEAVSQVMRRVPNIRAVCVGDGPDPYARDLKQLAEARLGNARVIWAGAQDNMVGVYNAIDVLALCSSVEGFPNVLAEAMACGTPVVTTSAGDAANIVADKRWVVRSCDSKEIAEAICLAIESNRKQTGMQHRERICKHYSMDSAKTFFLRAII